jgi:hypothetical protein
VRFADGQEFGAEGDSILGTDPTFHADISTVSTGFE